MTKKRGEFFQSRVGKAALERLKSLAPPNKIRAWADSKGLGGIRLDLVFLGHKSMTLASFYRVCEKLKLSPTWVLFGYGSRSLENKTDQERTKAARFNF